MDWPRNGKLLRAMTAEELVVMVNSDISTEEKTLRLLVNLTFWVDSLWGQFVGYRQWQEQLSKDMLKKIDCSGGEEDKWKEGDEWKEGMS